MTRGPAPVERGTTAFALTWMGAALVFVLLQVVVLAAAGAAAATAYDQEWHARARLAALLLAASSAWTFAHG